MFARAIRAFPGAVVALILAAAPSYANHATVGKHKVVHPRQRPTHHTRSTRWHRQHRARAQLAAYASDPAATNDADAPADDASDAPLTGKAIESGIASWYGKWHQGRRTANGERFDENALTAAHRWLPLGSRVRVRLVGTSRYVDVTINDRPGTRRRIIDLSREAARELGMLHNGTALVTISKY